MNKQLILSALRDKLELVKQSAESYEREVFDPAIDAMSQEVSNWLSDLFGEKLDRVSLSVERLTIHTDNERFGSTLDLYCRNHWREEGARCFEFSFSSGNITSEKDNSLEIKRLKIVSALAGNFSTVCAQFEKAWAPRIAELNEPRKAYYKEIHSLEQEITACVKDIEAVEMQKYNEVGFECQLKDRATAQSFLNVEGKTMWQKKMQPQTISLYYGRGKWNYTPVHYFKVLAYPKSKHRKVVLDCKRSPDSSSTVRLEINKQRYSEFVSEVHNWQTVKADKRAVEVDRKVVSWNAF